MAETIEEDNRWAKGRSTGLGSSRVFFWTEELMRCGG
jgi:hypothetical protein